MTTPSMALTAETSAESSTAAASRVYWPALDGLRFLAFFAVFLSHLESVPIRYTLPAWLIQALSFWNTLMAWGWIGVDIFFVLSGFLITSLLLKEREAYGAVSFKLFFMRRALRIWPLYFFMVVLGFVLLPLTGFFNMPLGSPAWHAMMSTYLPSYLVFMANFCFLTPITVSIPAFLAGGWSVAMEEQFYVAWGSIVSRVSRLSSLTWLVLLGFPFSLLLRVFVYNISDSHHAYYANTLTHLDPLLAGIALALMLFRQPRLFEVLRPYGALLFTVPILGLLVFMLSLPNIEANPPAMPYALSAMALGSAMFLLGTLVWPPAQRFFARSGLKYLGQLTYGMYFLHPLAIELVKPVVLGLFGPAFASQIYLAWGLFAVLSLLLTIAMAWASWHLLEKHFNQLRQRFAKIPSGGA